MKNFINKHISLLLLFMVVSAGGLVASGAGKKIVDFAGGAITGDQITPEWVNLVSSQTRQTAINDGDNSNKLATTARVKANTTASAASTIDMTQVVNELSGIKTAISNLQLNCSTTGGGGTTPTCVDVADKTPYVTAGYVCLTKYENVTSVYSVPYCTSINTVWSGGGLGYDCTFYNCCK